MKLGFCCALAVPTICCSPLSAQTMTLEQARARIPERRLPAFWVRRCERTGGALGQAESWITAIAISPGGWPLHLISYGEREPLTDNANFNSAIGGGDPSAYMDKKARHKPVLLFVGPVHGHEVEGLSGLVNFVQIMETGGERRTTAAASRPG